MVDTDLVDLKDVSKQFGAYNALRGINLSIPKGEIVALLGPSGCGKTTLLRCIAGLEQPTSGLIEISGYTVFSSTDGINAPPEERRIGLVFQSYALWPHLTVAQNVGYGLQVKGVRKPEIAERVARILATVGLGAMADRYPSTLSGGQQQRVALARSLVVEADVILFDEPLSNLDLKLREEMRFELRKLINRIGVTAIFVTHDQSEAMVLADRICLMRSGELIQDGAPREVYEQPKTRFSMDFLGSANFLEGALEGENGWRLPSGDRLGIGGRNGQGGVVGIRPERIDIVAREIAGDNVIGGVIRDVVFLGGQTIYEVEAGGTVVQVFSAEPDHRKDSAVNLRFPPQWLRRVEG